MLNEKELKVLENAPDDATHYCIVGGAVSYFRGMKENTAIIFCGLGEVYKVVLVDGCEYHNIAVLRKQKEQDDKTMKIVDAVNELRGELTASNCMFYNDGEDVIALDKGEYLALKSQSMIMWEVVCTIDEFNKYVKEMSNYAGDQLFNEYVMSDKQALTMLDYDIYKGLVTANEVLKYKDGDFVPLDEVDEPVEWVNGDACICSNDLIAYKYVGYSTVSKNLSVVMDSTQNVKVCYTSELSKPETAQQKAAKELDAKIKALEDLYYLHVVWGGCLEVDLVRNVVGAIADYVYVK